MPIFSKLFEILPDAEDLLNLEPEELAGPLLVSFQNTKQIYLDGVISDNKMRDAIDRNSHLNYPSGCHDDVLLALMEAWQYLLSEGFAAPIPGTMPGFYSYQTTTYFITRRGKKIETLDDFETYRKANLLPKHQLHPVIAQKVSPKFLQGDYDTSVFQAFKEIEIAVRKAGNYAETDIGVSLMRKAFHINDGNLTDSSQQPAEKQARSDLFAGAIGSLKNPSSHRDVDITAEEAAEVIIFASHLLRIVDSCEERISNPPT
jgi:uncharacterized protein (TIGR02391 family)